MHLRVIFFSLLLAFTIVGCGGAEDTKPVYVVNGKITMAGAPVPKASVIFAPNDGQPVAYGTTEADGTFQLTTYEYHDGAAEGKFDVLVSKSAPPPASDTEQHDETGATTFQEPVHDSEDTDSSSGASALDPKWSRPGNGLVAEVKKDGDNTFEFKLE
jgi:hypothetical protein